MRVSSRTVSCAAVHEILPVWGSKEERALLPWPSVPQQILSRAVPLACETELARAVRAAKRAGGERVEIDPQTGKISVIVGNAGESVADNEVENWLSKQQGQHANQR